MTLTTERANPLRQWNPDWGGCSTARRPVAAVNTLFLRRSVFVKRFTHEMTLREVPAVRRPFSTLGERADSIHGLMCG